VKREQVLSEPGFILHTRPYRETSALLEVFTKNHGRVSLVARGVRKKNPLQMFVHYDFSWIGRSELYTLTRAESVGASHLFSPYQLCCGLYINELLLRVLHKEDAHRELYLAYEELLAQFRESQNIEIALRIFEKHLLQDMGYGFAFEKIIISNYYIFRPSEGFVQVTEKSPESFSGESLLALANHAIEEKHLNELKRLMRQALSPLIGEKPLRSRELFV